MVPISSSAHSKTQNPRKTQNPSVRPFKNPGLTQKTTDPTNPLNLVF